MRLGTIAVGLSMVVGLTAACGDDSKPSGSEDTRAADGGDTAAPPGDDPRTSAERTADQEAAKAIVLTLDDLEAGWESTPPDEETDNDKEMKADLADCLGIDPDVMDPDNPSADSPDFTSPNDEEVSASVSYTPSIEAAEQAVELLRDEDLPSCFAQALKTAIMDNLLNPPEGEAPPDDLEVGEPTFNPISFGDLGDETVAYRATIPLSSSGIDVDVYFDIVAVRVGRVGIEATFQSTFSPFSTDEAERLVEVMIDRVPADA